MTEQKSVNGKNCHFYKQCKSEAEERIIFRSQSIAVCLYHKQRLKDK